jgi:hypothetical protein
MPTEHDILQKQLPTNLFQKLIGWASLFPCNPSPDTGTPTLPSSIEFYLLVHTATTPSVCQHFLCNNQNEANMMYHAWTFPASQFNLEVVVNNF